MNKDINEEKRGGLRAFNGRKSDEERC